MPAGEQEKNFFFGFAIGPVIHNIEEILGPGPPNLGH